MTEGVNELDEDTDESIDRVVVGAIGAATTDEVKGLTIPVTLAAAKPQVSPGTNLTAYPEMYQKMRGK